MKKYIYIKQKKEEANNSRAHIQIIKLRQKTSFKNIVKYSVIQTLKISKRNK